jgi:hypothetical protein
MEGHEAGAIPPFLTDIDALRARAPWIDAADRLHDVLAAY